MEERGVAPVVGIVLLLGLVLTSGIALFAVGSVALDSMQSDAQVDQAENAMVQYADSVQNGESTSLSLPDGGQTEVSSDSTIRVEVGYDEVVDTTLGSVIYEENGNQRVFEGGAVFSQSNGQPSIVSQPPISYEYVEDEQHQTLNMDVVTVDGSVDDLGTGSAFDESDAESVVSGSYNHTITITIQSEYAQAWATYFEETTNALVNFDASTSTVTATLPVVRPVAVENSFTVDGSIGLGGGVGVSSYDSRTAPNDGSVGIGNYQELDGGDVLSTGGFDGSGSAKINGNLYVDDDFKFDGGTDVSGDIYASGNVTIATSTTIDSRIVAGGDVILNNGGVNFGHDAVVRAGGDLVQQDYAEYDGTIHVAGDVDGNGHSSNYDSSTEFLAGGTVSLASDPEGSGVSITENADDPMLTELDRIDEMVASIPNPADRVSDAQSKYSEAPTADLGGNSADDELTAGNYRVAGDLTYDGSPSLTFDTTDGEINLLVEGDVEASNLYAEVIGNNQVNLYVTGNFETTGDPKWTNPVGAGNRLVIYTAEESETTKVQSSSGFYGVVFSESDLELGGGTSVYGAIVMNGSDVNGGQNVYFDEALKGTDLSNDNTGPQNAEKTYLHISRVSV